MTMAPTEDRKKLLDFIIDHQEGGWVLTATAGDNDGGWTYAGVTAKTFCAFWKDTMPDIADLGLTDHIKSQIEGDKNWAANEVYEIYSKKYCAPLQLDDIPRILKGPLLSCAINCGVETAITILQKVADVKQDGEMGPRTLAAITVANNRINSFLFERFLREWTRHYIQLCTPKDTDEVTVVLKRLKFLEGWFNRVEFWRSWENAF